MDWEFFERWHAASPGPDGETPRERVARFYVEVNAVGGVFPAGWAAAGMTAQEAQARLERVGVKRFAAGVRARSRKDGLL